ncbi:plasmid stabilization protein [Rhodanobacter sp. FW510-R12]|uniref:cupredoxin domain-containing protein n=1 Tax=unclassified Rhodanobacter TaxID=2621553 RepID=UPI0007A9F7F7|nr:MULTISPECIES: cupredoxin domain-containing protein [unclassified Rhodanobacter]KZC17828.1 plasmid stabilization protein [Rhodanobacter sp. FW104-R8]KZC27167.1 plasmid stabilization protein [Rhodanobacter sp. FW510-T8]KZC31605.1 plasmid stabilization protein [Rhodanobacter sp. FW510-R10]
MLRTMILLVAVLAFAGGFMPAVAADTAATAPGRRVHVILVDKMAYGPMPTGVRAGDIIEWANHDILEHSATARDGRFDVDLKPGASAHITATAGTLAFFCKFHPTMTGSVVVK